MYVVSTSVTVVTPVVIGTSVHLSSSHEVMVMMVVEISVSVSVGPGSPVDGGSSVGFSVVGNGHQVVYVVSTSVTVVTPVVTGTSVHEFSLHEVIVMTVVSISVLVEVGGAVELE